MASSRRYLTLSENKYGDDSYRENASVVLQMHRRSWMQTKLTFTCWIFPTCFVHSKSEDAQKANFYLDLPFLVTMATLGYLQRLLRTREPHKDQDLHHRGDRRQFRWMRRQRVRDWVVQYQGEWFIFHERILPKRKCELNRKCAIFAKFLFCFWSHFPSNWFTVFADELWWRK